MLITVEKVGPYGVLVDGKWIKYGKTVNSKEFVSGGKYNVETFQGKTALFINKVLSKDETGAKASVPVLNPDTNTIAPAVSLPVTPTKYGKPISEWEIREAKMIQRSGLVQASVQAVSAHSANKEELVSNALEVAEKLLKWVREE